MSDCLEVLARSAIVSTKREECDQLGQGHALPVHNVKLEWLSEMNCPGDARYELSPFQSSYTGYSLDDRSGLNSHLQHYCSKQLSQGGAFMSASGVNSEPLGVSTDSSTVLNTWSSDGGGSVSQKAKINQMRPVEEQWWVDFISPGSIVVPSTLSQLENNALSATVEFGVPKQQIEDLERMLLTQAADPTNMKWFSGDGQTYGQGDIQPVLDSGGMDTSMFEQDSWSSNQYQSGHHNVDNSLSRQMPHECTTGDTFSSLNSTISFSSSSPKPNSDSSFLHSSYSSLPRALSLPSQLYDISINSLNHTGATGPPPTASLIASMDGPGGHSFSAPESFAAAMPLSPNAPATGKCYARSLMVGNSMSGGQHHLGNSYSVHEASLVMEEGSVAMQGSLSSSPSSVHAPSNNIPSLTSGFHHQEDDKEVGQRSILVRSLSSLVSTDFQNQPLKSPSVVSGDYLLQRQRSWTGGRVASRWNRAGPDIRSPEVAGYWKSETMNNRTGCALSPLSSIPGSSPSCPQHASSRFQQTGVERKLEDVKLDTGQVEGGVIPEGGLAIVNLLLRAAEAVDIGNAEMAKAILARLNQHISPTREKSIHRVAHYFREALVTRLLGQNFVAQLSQDRTLSPLEEFHKINAYVRFCEVSPYPKFAHFTANQAILEALDGEEAMHIIDFQMGAGAQWASFLQDIASLKAAGKVISKVRLTAVGTRADEIRATGANLCNFARMMNIALEFQAVVTRPECLDVSMLGLRDNEAVAGNFIFSLHELLDGETCNGLSTVLKSVLQARPKVVTTVEQEANHSGPFFQQRFSEALQYYMFLFDSLTSSLEAGADSSVNSSIESCLLAPEIMNIVACDGVARVERHERLAQWRERMLAVGFSPRPLSVASQVQAERLVTQISARGGFQVIRDQGGLLLGWQGRPLLAASSWMC